MIFLFFEKTFFSVVLLSCVNPIFSHFVDSFSEGAGKSFFFFHVLKITPWKIKFYLRFYKSLYKRIYF